MDSSDSDDERESRRPGREPLELPDQAGEMNGAEDASEVCLIELEESQRCTTRRSNREADVELTHFEPVVQPDNRNLRLRANVVGVKLCRVRSWG